MIIHSNLTEVKGFSTLLWQFQIQEYRALSHILMYFRDMCFLPSVSMIILCAIQEKHFVYFTDRNVSQCRNSLFLWFLLFLIFCIVVCWKWKGKAVRQHTLCRLRQFFPWESSFILRNTNIARLINQHINSEFLTC